MTDASDLVGRLLPCRHCGADMAQHRDYVNGHAAICLRCGMQTMSFPTERQATESWNRRVPDQQQAARIKAHQGAGRGARSSWPVLRPCEG